MTQGYAGVEETSSADTFSAAAATERTGMGSAPGHPRPRKDGREGRAVPHNAPGMRVCTSQPVLEGRGLRCPLCTALRGPAGDAERGTRPLSTSVLSTLLLGTGQARGSPQRRFRAR